MARAKKTWREKLDDAKAKPGLPKVFFCEKAKQRLVVPSPAEIERIIRSIRPGNVLTMDQVCQRLRETHKADQACPMTTGIFAWLIAHASEESAAGGDKRPAPWWRLLKTGGLLNPKYPGGGRLQRQRLEAEGHKVVAKGKALAVCLWDAEERNQ